MFTLIHGYKYKGVKRTSEPELSVELLKSVDIVMVTAAHTNVDYDFVQANAIEVFDTKNAMKNVKNRENITLL